MFGLFETDLAIDLGAAKTMVYAAGRGVVVNEPSVVALERGPRGEVMASGKAAKRMIGRTSTAVRVVRPVRRGAVVDPDLTACMLQGFLKRAFSPAARLLKPRVAVCVPTQAGAIEERSFLQVVSQVAHKVAVIDRTLAAAQGVGLPIDEASGMLIVDIGAGITDIALITMGEIVCAESLPIAGETFDQAITALARKQLRLRIGETTAELVKMVIGSAHVDFDGQELKVAGQDLATGLPREAILTGAAVREALEPLLGSIVDGVHRIIEQGPPDLMGDVHTAGLTMTGGGALLKGLDKRMQEELKLPVRVASNALSAVAEGAAERLRSGRSRATWCM
jgi:rod shape-determining protein MreB and related proteins